MARRTRVRPPSPGRPRVGDVRAPGRIVFVRRPALAGWRRRRLGPGGRPRAASAPPEALCDRGSAGAGLRPPPACRSVRPSGAGARCPDDRHPADGAPSDPQPLWVRLARTGRAGASGVRWLLAPQGSAGAETARIDARRPRSGSAAAASGPAARDARSSASIAIRRVSSASAPPPPPIRSPWGGERAAQLAQAGPEASARLLRAAILPEECGQGIARDRCAGGEREPRENEPGLSGGDAPLPALHAKAERAEQRQPRRGIRCRRRRHGRCRGPPARAIHSSIIRVRSGRRPAPGRRAFRPYPVCPLRRRAAAANASAAGNARAGVTLRQPEASATVARGVETPGRTLDRTAIGPTPMPRWSRLQDRTGLCGPAGPNGADARGRRVATGPGGGARRLREAAPFVFCRPACHPRSAELTPRSRSALRFADVTGASATVRIRPRRQRNTSRDVTVKPLM